MLSVEVPSPPFTGLILRLVVKPVCPVALRLTGAVKPLKGDMEIVDAAEVPETIIKPAGFVVREKSAGGGTIRGRVVRWEPMGLFPVRGMVWVRGGVGRVVDTGIPVLLLR